MPDLRRRECGLHPARPRLVERRAEIERVGHRIEHRFRRDVGLRRMQRRRELDVVGAQFARKRHPIFNRPIGIGIADVTRRQLLQRGRQDRRLS